MYRNIVNSLQSWQHKKDRKPLILTGVRQCGKSYVLEKFGKSSFQRHHLINFEEQRSLHKVFAGDLTAATLISELEFALGTNINLEQDLLIFDEIQACPNALTSLKYFSEQIPNLALAAAGSLLGLHLSHGSFPVGKVDFLDLYPLSFGEFLLALDEKQLSDYCQSLDWHTDMPLSAHERLWQRFKQYLVTGGLPEVVKTFITQQESLHTATESVRQKQHELVRAYYADIAKHAGKENAMHIERIFESIPKQLSRTQDSSAPRFQFRGVVPGIDHYQRLSGAIDWLNKAGLLVQTPIINHAIAPLAAHSKANLFKLYCFDCGVLGTMSDIPPVDILQYNFNSYKGYMAENFVAQSLKLSGINAYCWQDKRAEVEFVCQLHNKITPIEVKAGHITKAKSLDKFTEQYNPDFSIILSANAYTASSVRPKHIPLYLAEWLQSSNIS